MCVFFSVCVCMCVWVWSKGSKVYAWRIRCTAHVDIWACVSFLQRLATHPSGVCSFVAFTLAVCFSFKTLPQVLFCCSCFLCELSCHINPVYKKGGRTDSMTPNLSALNWILSQCIQSLHCRIIFIFTPAISPSSNILIWVYTLKWHHVI